MDQAGAVGARSACSTVAPRVSSSLFSFFFVSATPTDAYRNTERYTTLRPVLSVSLGRSFRVYPPSDVPSINHNIRINIPRASFAPRSGFLLALRPPGWMTRPTHRRCKNFPIEESVGGGSREVSKPRGARIEPGARYRGKSNRYRDKTRESFNKRRPVITDLFLFCGRGSTKSLKQAAAAAAAAAGIFHPG